MDDQCSGIYRGLVMHHRFHPVRHRFIYRVFSLCVDLDELPRLNRLRFFSINRLNLFSFHEKDHGSGEGDLAGFIRQLLIKRGYRNATHSIKLLCYPRILGYTFNPLSVYFCYNSSGQLKVILYEVSNTFGSRHTYLLENRQCESRIRQTCNKTMYVSPFMPLETQYSFHITPPADKVAVCIRQSEKADTDGKQRPLLHATFSGDRNPFSDRTLIKLFFLYPLMTLKVITAIHWEAFRLWRKKLSIQPREKNRSNTISWQDEQGVSHYESL